MAKKFFKRALSVGLSLVLCGGMVVPSLAASFADLQGAISATNDSNEFTADDGTIRYGYGKGEGSKWEIEAWGEKNDRNVKLHEDVVYGGDPEATPSQDIKSIEINNAKVNLDLNGKTIDGGCVLDEDQKPVEGKEGNGASVIKITNGSDVTIRNGNITGGNGGSLGLEGSGSGNGGGIYSGNSDLRLEDVNVYGNYAKYGGGIFFETDNDARTFAMKGGSVYGNGVYASGNGGGIYTKGHKDGRVSATMTDVEVYNNNGSSYGGGIRMWGTDMTLTDVDITNNRGWRFGGGVVVSGGSKLTMVRGSISGNRSYGTDDKCLGGGGLFIDRAGDTAKLTGVTITGNTSTVNGGGIYLHVDKVNEAPQLTLGDGNMIYGNTSQAGDSDIYAVAGAVVKGLDNTPNAPAGKQFDGWYTENGKGTEYKGPAEIENTVDLVGSLSNAPVVSDPGDDISIGDPDVPLGEDPAEDDSTIEIEDPEVPLAGLFTRADAIGYLWEQTGSPDAELSDFPDVPEDHYWAVAIGWAQDMGIALPDEEGNFRPDDLVLRSSSEPEGELQQFLNRYAVFAGAAEQGESFIQLTGAWDDVIMGEEAQVIFDDFFAKLEAALAEQAA